METKAVLPVAVPSTATETMASTADAASKPVPSDETVTAKVWATAGPGRRAPIKAGIKARSGWHGASGCREAPSRPALR